MSNLKHFAEGLGSVLNLEPEPDRNPAANKSDLERLTSDWHKIKSDLPAGWISKAHAKQKD